MNDKKKIFLVIMGILTIFIIIIFMVIMWNWGNSKNVTKSANNFKIWILNDSKEDFAAFIEDFKKDKGISNFTTTIESFDSYENYNKALSSAIVRWEAPDIYMLNNNEKSIFLENASWINPNIINPDELSSGWNFKWFFADDLIMSSWEGDNRIEFLAWIPFWFETLGVYINTTKKWWLADISSFPKIRNSIEDFNKRNKQTVALWIGRWITVMYVEDIITQFIMSDWINNILWLQWSNIRNIFSEYFDYASWKNNYISKDIILKWQWKTNLDLFVDWEIAMIFGYPRMLFDIDERGFSKTKLRVSNFPTFINDSNTLVNYNYFVVNKNSNNQDMAYTLLKYIFSEEWEKKYLKHFNYYIPARWNLREELSDRVIIDSLKFVKLKDFYDSSANYSSFDKGLKDIYDREMIKLVDSEENYLINIQNFVLDMKCKTDKVIRLENLSKNCK